jgi:hypothetical protein
MRRYCIRKISPIVIVFALLVIIFITPTTLQPSLATANYTLVQSNQTTSTVVDKTTNVTLRGIFDDQGYPGSGINCFSLPLMNSIDAILI